MRHKTKLIEFVIILMAFFLILGCDPDAFQWDDIYIDGTGCRYEDTYKVERISNDDGDTITVDLSAFNAATEEDDDWESLECSVLVEIPAGMSLGLAGMDHEGSAYIPSGGEGTLVWYQSFFTGNPTNYTSSITTRDENHEFSFKSTAPVLWSECNEHDSEANFSTSISADREPNSSVQAQMNVSKMKIYLKWKECE